MATEEHTSAVLSRLTVGGILREVIAAHGQIGVAAALNCDQKTVSRFISGELAFNPESIDKLLELDGRKLVLADAEEFAALRLLAGKYLARGAS